MGGVITSSALALALGLCLWPARARLHAVTGGEAVASAPRALAQPPVTAAAPPAPCDLFRQRRGASRGGRACCRGRGFDCRGFARLRPPAISHNPSLFSGCRVRRRWPRRPSIRTGAAETLQVTLRGGAEARLERSSVMNVDAQPNGNDRPTVERGEVAFSVPHQLPGQHFSVVAGPYRIVVVGTKFRLHVEGDHVAVAVDEGVVEIWRRNRLARLVPGDSWSSPLESSARAASDSARRSRPSAPAAASEAGPPPAGPAPRARHRPGARGPGGAGGWRAPPRSRQLSGGRRARRTGRGERRVRDRPRPARSAGATRGRHRGLAALPLLAPRRSAACRDRRVDHRDAGQLG